MARVRQAIDRSALPARREREDLQRKEDRQASVRYVRSVLHSRHAVQEREDLQQKTGRQASARYAQSVRHSRHAMQEKADLQRRTDLRETVRLARITLHTGHDTVKAEGLRSISQEATDRGPTVRSEATDRRAAVHSETEEPGVRKEAAAISAEAREHVRNGESHEEMR